MVEDYEQVQLRENSTSRSDGTWIMYLAPNNEIRPQDSKFNTSSEIPEKASLVIDLGGASSTVTVQGSFKPSTDLPDAHASALETKFGYSPVTAEDQMHRLRSYTTWSLEGDKFVELYTQNSEYRLDSQPTTTNIQNGVYPHGIVKELRFPQQSGMSNRIQYTLKLEVGLKD